jgi:hypothetical protein
MGNKSNTRNLTWFHWRSDVPSLFPLSTLYCHHSWTGEFRCIWRGEVEKLNVYHLGITSLF